jgi:hypothetical protein
VVTISIRFLIVSNPAVADAIPAVIAATRHTRTLLRRPRAAISASPCFRDSRLGHKRFWVATAIPLTEWERVHEVRPIRYFFPQHSEHSKVTATGIV